MEMRYRNSEDSSRNFTIYHLLREYFLPLSISGFVGLLVGIFVRLFGLWVNGDQLHWFFYYIGILFIIAFPYLLFLIFLRKQLGMVNLTGTTLMPNPIMTGFSFGYFIVFI